MLDVRVRFDNFAHSMHGAPAKQIAFGHGKGPDFYTAKLTAGTQKGWFGR